MTEWESQLQTALERFASSPNAEELEYLNKELLELWRSANNRDDRALIETVAERLLATAAGSLDYVTSLFAWMEGQARHAPEGAAVEVPLSTEYKRKVLRWARASAAPEALIEAHRFDPTVPSETLLSITLKVKALARAETPLRPTARVGRNAYFGFLRESELRRLKLEEIAEWWDVLTDEWVVWLRAGGDGPVPGVDVPIDRDGLRLRIDPAARLPFTEWLALSRAHEAGILPASVHNDISALRPVSRDRARSRPQPT